MALPYIPPKDADLDAWAINFSALISASPSTYGLVSGDATAIAAAVSPYTLALAAATNPTTRTAVTVAAKDTAKFAMLTVVRTYAQIISANPSVLASDKIALGLNLHGTPPSPVPAPTTFPILSIINATTLLQTLRYADELTPARRLRAPNTAGMEHWIQIATAPGTDPLQATFRSLVTRQPVLVPFVSDDVGKIATHWGRWINRKGEPGPWSSPVAFTIA